MAETLDDLLRRVFEKLLKSNNHVNPTKGANTELTGVLLKITNPRARLSRTEMKGTLFSCLGELLWYLAKSDDLEFIRYYLKDYGKFSDDGETLYGAYGPRIFCMRGNNQIENIIDLLRKKPQSRQAVIQLFNAEDITQSSKDVPCTCTLQFLIRRRHLDMITNMRSNDAYLGLPHDVFSFTMIQEIVARKLNVELGTYKHFAGSLHLYDNNRNDAQVYLIEGWQPTLLSMPPMPASDPQASISSLLRAEHTIRSGREVKLPGLNLDPYWADLVRILQIYAKTGDEKEIEGIKKDMNSNVYGIYIEKRKNMKPPVRLIPNQLNLLLD